MARLAQEALDVYKRQVLFRSARFGVGYGPTGIHDQQPELGGRDYGRGFWSQQWLGLKRMVGRDREPAVTAPPSRPPGAAEGA